MQQPRREFLETLAVTLSASVLSAQTRSGDMIYRTLGKTGERVSAIGLGRISHRSTQRGAGRHPHHP